MKVSQARQSKNVIDIRAGKGKTKNELDINHSRQIFDPKTTGKLTKISNMMANADRLANKGRGAQAMKAPAKKVMYNKFEKKGK